MRSVALLVMSLGVFTACGGEPAADSSADAQSVAAQRSDNGVLCVLNTRLLPENEVRTAANTADPTVESTATGHAQVKIRNDGTLEVKVFILNKDAEAFTAGHIHEGPAGTNGPIVVPLFSVAPEDAFTGEHFVQHEVITVPEEFDVTEICADPSAYYVNYHTTQDPVGATRGQL
jgi:hypothetical protein